MQKQATIIRSSQMEQPEEDQEEDFDLFSPTDFARALQKKVGRPFAFGPIEFSGLDSDDTFDGGQARNQVVEFLESTTLF